MRRRFCILIVALLVLALLPTAAMASGAKLAPARGIRPLVVYGADAFEKDDTTATAKALPAESRHTSQYLGVSAGDVDWYTFTAEATGQPFVLDTEYFDGYWDPYMQVFKAEANGSMTALTADNDDDNVFWTYASALYFTAPAPGTYYGRVRQRNGYSGLYGIQISPGIARRLGGANRFETAVKLSKRMYGNTANAAWGGDAGPMAILLANSLDAPDAMTAGVLGAMYKDGSSDRPAPVLLTTRDLLPPVTKAEIERLAYGQQTTVYVLGAANQVSDAQLAYLKTLANVADVVRVAGPTRFATASQIASVAVEHTDATVDTVFIANGFAWVDGLAAGPVAGVADAPLLLTAKDALPSATIDWIDDHPDVTNAVVVGSPSVVDTDVVTELEDMGLSVDRVGGIDRYETARLLAQYGVDNYGLSADSMVLATGVNFADGLAATPMTGMMNGPILLTRPTGLSSEVEKFWDDNGPTKERSYIIGGPAAIPAPVATAFGELWKRPL